MKLAIILLTLITTIIFGMSMFVGGAIAMRPYIEAARFSQLQPDTIVALSLQDLSNVPITQRVL